MGRPYQRLQAAIQAVIFVGIGIREWVLAHHVYRAASSTSAVVQAFDAARRDNGAVALPSHISERDGAALVSVRVRPRGGRDAVERVRGDALVVRVAAPPVGGAANDALRRVLAKACGVAPGRVTVVRGERGRDKVLRVDGLSGRDAAARLEAACG